MEPKIEKLLVTPEMATEWLQNNDHNRPIDWRLVQTYQRQMENGAWKFVGDPIRIGVTGRLLDGQNRLTAVVLTGKPQTFVVISKLAEDTQAYMDVGKRRTPGDIFTMEGVTDGRGVSSLASMLMLYEKGVLLDSKYQVTVNETLDYYRHPENTDLINKGTQIGKQVRRALPFNPAVAGTVWVAVSRTSDPFTVNEFFEKLLTGLNLGEGDPILALRNWVIRRRREDVRVNRNEYFYVLIRVWNAWVQGEQVWKLQLPQGGVTDPKQLPQPLPAGPRTELVSEDNPAVTPRSLTRKELEARARVS